MLEITKKSDNYVVHSMLSQFIEIKGAHYLGIKIQSFVI
jgi:hypothetical protein